MSASLVGSEMCIRDRGNWPQAQPEEASVSARPMGQPRRPPKLGIGESRSCLLYTSDAADDM
eukprot:4200163-Alexandrium_andersonii.AAC.1